MKGVRRYSCILLLLFAGCGIEDKRPDPYPVGATNIQSYGKGWSTFEWQKQEFLQFSSDNGHGYRIISITKLGPMSRARAIVEEMRVTSSGDEKYLDEFRNNPDLLEAVKALIEEERTEVLKQLRLREN